jgi:hypothetical protein
MVYGGWEMAAVPLSIGQILDLDAEYRRAAAEDRLKKIAPKEHNPSGEAWLPLMYHRLDGARVMLLYSNTALAHRAHKTHDWVVLYYKPLGGKGPESQVTILTEWRKGPLKDLRVVRGREAETEEYYRHKAVLEDKP